MVVAAVVAVGTGVSAMAPRATVVRAAAGAPPAWVPRPAAPPSADPPAADPPAAASSEPGAATPSAAANPAAPGLGGARPARTSRTPSSTVIEGRYFLYTSGIPGPPAVNVPVASATDFDQWSPVTDALPTLPRWAVPGYTWAPDVHRFGSTYVLYFTAMVGGTSPAMECIGDATGPAPDGPFTPIDAPFICQADHGRLDRPPGLHRRRRHHLDAVEVRPEHRRAPTRRPRCGRSA